MPEDARARILRAGMYAQEGRTEDSVREANLAMVLRPNEATVLYNAACTFASLGKRDEAIDALRKAWDAGFKDADWTRRDPDLTNLHGDPDFERLYPATKAEGKTEGHDPLSLRRPFREREAGGVPPLSPRERVGVRGAPSPLC